MIASDMNRKPPFTAAFLLRSGFFVENKSD